MDADALSRIDWEKYDETIQADSIQAIVAAAITGDVANIEVVSCSMQTIESFFPIPSDTISIRKFITSSSTQSHTTCPEPELSMIQQDQRQMTLNIQHCLDNQRAN